MVPAQAPSQRRALVTGASSGIGEATARLLAQQGYRVALLARRESELERVRASLSHPERHVCVPCDLRDSAALIRAAAVVGERFGALDLLVQNAGHGYLARVEESRSDVLRSLVETNVVAVLDLARESLPLLRRGERPVMVLVSSIVARRGIPGQVAYAASKAALNSIGEGLRIEWASESVAVSLLDVGLTRTPFFATQPNPSGLPGPDVSGAESPERVAAEILALDRRPQPERWMSWKWRALSLVGLIAPRLSDRLLVRRMGGGWRTPER